MEMKCPKCQNEISNNAKYCAECGCNLAEEMTKAQEAKQPVCKKCGARLIQGARFCTKCGEKIAPAEAPKKEGQKTNDEQAMIIGNNRNLEISKVDRQEQAFSVGKNVVSLDKGSDTKTKEPETKELETKESEASKKGNDTKTKESEMKESEASNKTQEKTGAGLYIAVVVLFLLVIASGVACFLVWNGTISLPVSTKDTELADKDGDAEDETGTSEEKGTEGTSEMNTEKAELDVNTEELFVEADSLLTEGKSQIAVDAEIVNGMENLNKAIGLFAQKAEETGDAGLAADKITDAYASYVSAVIAHKDMLSTQALSGAVYGQIMSEMDGAADLADELEAKGYTLDTSSLLSARDAFEKSYTDSVISTFDAFTTREAWSRTEAWNLMADTPDNMFDTADVDNPIRLRYVYALSWWTQKQIETELSNGTITEKGAAIKIANLIDAMDYNPMMIQYYIVYMNEAGEDCREVSIAFDEVVQHLAQTQGIHIGTDIPLEKFWYFNDFGTYSVDSINGVTPENRQWIRDRMRFANFIKQ